jgi:UDP-N-acetyl-D-glucosamine dehydrogenase
MTDRLVVIGQGYVGLPMALTACKSGLDVVGLETSARTVKNLNSGRSHIDDVSDRELSLGLANGYRASCNPTVISDADTVLVCVPTPLSPDGGPDLKAVEAAADTIATHVRPGTLVILESTSYPGTTQEVFAPRVNVQRFALGADLFIAFSPERIDPGNQLYGVANTPKVVGGMTAACTTRAVDFYTRFVEKVVPAKGAREAEMSKLIENTFRHVNIALMNEMLRFSHELDIDLWDAITCAETKPFGYMAFRPGPGVGGHCIPVDPSYLSHRVKAQLGYSFRMVELAEEINAAAPLYVANRIRELLNTIGLPVKGTRVLLLGVTYKPNIADCRQSPADPLAKQLISWGADLHYHDPYIPLWRPHGTEAAFDVVADVTSAAASADIVVLLQSHGVYDLLQIVDSCALLLDTRSVMPPSLKVHRL